MQVHATLWISHRDGTLDGASQQRPGAGAEGEHMARIVILGGHGKIALLAAGLDQAQVEHWFCRDLCGEMAG